MKPCLPDPLVRKEGPMQDNPPAIPAEATVEAVEKRIGRLLSPGQSAMASALLEEAWSNLLVDVPSLESRLEPEPRLPGIAANVLIAAVTRVVRNPEGWRQVGLDDFQGTRDSVLSAGILQFLPEELARLQPRTPGMPGAYSLRMGVPYWGD